MHVNDLPKPYIDALTKCIDEGIYDKKALDAMIILGHSNFDAAEIALLTWIDETYLKYKGMQLSPLRVFNAALLLRETSTRVRTRRNYKFVRQVCAVIFDGTLLSFMRDGWDYIRVIDECAYDISFTLSNLRSEGYDDVMSTPPNQFTEQLLRKCNEPPYTQMMGRWGR